LDENSEFSYTSTNHPLLSSALSKTGQVASIFSIENWLPNRSYKGSRNPVGQSDYTSRIGSQERYIATLLLPLRILGNCHEFLNSGSSSRFPWEFGVVEG
jgi:hypothetical protein